MCLQPYNSPQIRLKTSAAPSRLQPPAIKLSSSQENLLELPSADRSPSPLLPLADSRQRSRSLNTLGVMPPAQPARARATDTATLPHPKQAPPPTIMVEMDGARRGRSPTLDSEDSFLSDSTEFSISDSDPLDSSRGSSRLNLSVGHNTQELLRSRTPPPPSSHHLSPSVPGSKMTPSISDPNIYKGTLPPKIPPRPQAQEILTRCSTVTRKNVRRATPSPTQTEILSR